MAETAIMLHDFSFTSPEAILSGLGGSGTMHGMGGGEGGGMAMDHCAHGGSASEGGATMPAMMAHANDIADDDFLACDRTLGDPEVIAAEAGRPLRLRIIDGATASAFRVRTGAQSAEVVAVDGMP